MLENFKVYRRHDPRCPLAGEGVNADIKKCGCPLWVYGTDNWRSVRKSLKTRSVARAMERIVRLYREPQVEGAKPMTVEAARDAYLEDCQVRGLAVESLRNYRSRLGPFVEYFAGDHVRSITAEKFAAFRLAHPYGQAPATRRMALLVLRSFFDFCVARKWMTENPAAAMKLPRPDSALTMPYTAEEVERMLAACDSLKSSSAAPRTRQRARALILVLLYSGLRISDAVQLRRDAVDFKTGKVLLRVMKTRAPLYTRLPEHALDALRAIPQESAYFFWSGKAMLRTAISSASRTIYALGKAAGVEGARPHRFRDTFSVTLLINGADMRTVQMLLGHKSIITTEQHYAPFVAGMQRVVDQAVATLHFGSPSGDAARVVNALGDACGDADRVAGPSLVRKKSA